MARDSRRSIAWTFAVVVGAFVGDFAVEWVWSSLQDEVVPFDHGVRLHEAAPEPKSFSWMDGGGHELLNEAYSNTYYSSVTRFISSLQKS